jgi:nucleotide-binding universal stress UspA family protein
MRADPPTREVCGWPGGPCSGRVRPARDALTAAGCDPDEAGSLLPADVPTAVVSGVMMAGVDPSHAAAPPASFRRVLLPLDGSDFALAALPTARALAERFAADLVTVSVAADDHDAQQLRRHAADAIDADDENRVHVVVGADPAQTISALAADLSPCLICLSTSGRGRLAGAMIGSVARTVLQTSRQPLVAVGPLADRPPLLVGRPPQRPSNWPEPLTGGVIVACVDGSPDSEQVLPVAAQWATTLDMTIRIVTVAEDVIGLGGDRPRNRFGPSEPANYVERLAESWQGVVDDIVGEVVFDRIDAAHGLRALLDARPAGLVAVTTHARRGLDRIRLGTASVDIIRTSPIPALVVPLTSVDPPG